MSRTLYYFYYKNNLTNYKIHGCILHASGVVGITFKLTLTTKQRVQDGYTFGTLTWSNQSVYLVRTPIAGPGYKTLL
jgi:hypothetical protein